MVTLVVAAFAILLLCRDVSDQWLLGDSVLVSPVLHKNSSSRRAYFPAGIWHDLWPVDKPAAAAGSAQDTAAVRGPVVRTLHVPIGDVPLHVRGGSIVPLQRAAITTIGVRTSPVTLIVALEHEGTKRPAASTPERCERASRGTAGSNIMADKASDTEAAAIASSVAAAVGSGMRTVACGQLYVDDGESLQVPPAAADGYLLTQLTAAATGDLSKGLLTTLPFNAAAAAVDAVGGRETGTAAAEATVDAAAAGFKAPKLEAVVVLGLPNKIAGGADAWAVTVNGNRLAASQVQYDAAGQVLRLSGLQQQLAKGLAVQWERA
jgi:hypothetical protein